MTDIVDPKTEEQALQEWKNYCLTLCRKERDNLLAATDWIHMPDVIVAESFRASMNTYRQQLRDFPATFSTSFDSMSESEKYGVTKESLNFPTKPSP